MIVFDTEAVRFELKNKRKYKIWLQKIAEAEGFRIGELTYVFLNDPELLEINQQYLNHDTYTDIITFDNSDKENLIEGDIFMSLERIKENALKFNIDTEIELKRVMSHGLLHLCGYGDKSEEDIDLMRKKENEAIVLFSDLN